MSLLKYYEGWILTIESGEFVAVMGPSGSGKSTLMSIIGGIEPPTSGQVILDGVDIANSSDDQRTIMRRRKIGFVFQAFNLIPTLSALENVAFPLELDGVDRKTAIARASEALRTSGTVATSRSHSSQTYLGANSNALLWLGRSRSSPRFC